jgi:Mn-containing catalase
MTIIKDLVDMIEDELEGAEHYIKYALTNKAEMPQLSDVLYEISTQEMRHVNMLHDEVARIIKNHRERHGDPPAAMLAIYEWQHEKSIDKAKEIKILQSQYREGF